MVTPKSFVVLCLYTDHNKPFRKNMNLLLTSAVVVAAAAAALSSSRGALGNLENQPVF
jgi:hypothetical protein